MITSTWSPSDLSYPEVGDIDTGFFLVIEEGVYKGISYKEHDWLVYIANSEDKWFKLSGVAVVTDNLTAINKPNPGWYNKVRLDNNGNVIDADTDISADDLPSHTHSTSDISNLDSILENACQIATYESSGIKIENIQGVKTLSVKIDEDSIIQDENGNLMVNPDILSSIIDGSYEGNSCANHTHTSSQITDLSNAVTQILKESGLLTLDVMNIPIDEETIIVNENGQLSSVASAIQKHTHTIADITDLDPELLVFATCQMIVAKDSTVDLNQGKYMLSSLRLDQALAAMSLDLKLYDERLTSLENQITNRIPPLPDRLNTVVNESDSRRVFNIADISTEIKGFSSVSLRTNPLYIIPSENESGSLSLFVDNVEVISIDIGIPSVGKAFSDSHFNIVSKEDPYLGIAEYENYYESYVFTINYIPETEGIHTLKLVQNFKDKLFESNELTLAFYKNFSASIDIETSELPQASRYVSGVPTIETYPEFWYQTTITGLPTILPFDFYTSSIGNTKQDNPNATFSDNALVFDKTYIDLSKYTDSFSIYGVVKDFADNTFTDTVLVPKVRQDSTTVEQYRVAAVTTQNVSSLESTDYMNVFNPKSPLSNFEGQIVNDIGIIPSDDFTSIGGANYTDYSTDFSSDNTPIVWTTFRFDSAYINNLSMILEPVNGSFNLNKNGTLQGIELYIGLSNSTYSVSKWINANEPFDGCSSFTDYHFKGLDLFNSTRTIRVVTLGQKEPVENKYVFVRLGYSRSVNLKTFVNSIIESLERYNSND